MQKCSQDKVRLSSLVAWVPHGKETTVEMWKGAFTNAFVVISWFISKFCAFGYDFLEWVGSWERGHNHVLGCFLGLRQKARFSAQTFVGDVF